MNCFRCGDCCKAPYYGMTLTQEELDLLPIKLDVIQVGKDRFRGRGSVCPLFLNSECSVYEIRPCQCRLFHCGRRSLTETKLATITEIQKMMEQDPEYREFKIRMDEEAIIWGNAHCWNWKKMK
jgi:Fe-S-cluster containining protein